MAMRESGGDRSSAIRESAGVRSATREPGADRSSAVRGSGADHSSAVRGSGTDPSSAIRESGGGLRSSAIEDYTKAIYALERHGSEPVTTNALADRLGVTAGSASGMVKRLGELGLAEHRPYHG